LRPLTECLYRSLVALGGLEVLQFPRLSPDSGFAATTPPPGRPSPISWAMIG